MDFVKGPKERITIVDYFIASTVLICSTGDLQKMWGRIRAKAQGVLPFRVGEIRFQPNINSKLFGSTNMLNLAFSIDTELAIPLLSIGHSLLRSVASCV